jgi:membrane-associated phospholipid phosphatase
MARRPHFLLALAAASAAAAFAVWLAAFVVPGGRELDGRALLTFTGVARPPLRPSIKGIALLADPWPFGIVGLALVCVALVRRRWLMAAMVPVILLSANGTTQQLKPALADLRTVDLRGVDSFYTDSWPSGHATASMSLALCLVLVVGPRLRPLAALVGAAYAIAVGYALVVLSYHLPSDVLGGYLVAATFMLLGTAALAGLEGRWPVRAPRPVAPGPRRAWPVLLSGPMLTAFAVLAIAAAAVGVLWLVPGAMGDVLQHPIAVLAGIGIAGLGLALTTGMARLLRG